MTTSYRVKLTVEGQTKYLTNYYPMSGTIGTSKDVKRAWVMTEGEAKRGWLVLIMKELDLKDVVLEGVDI